MRIDLPRTLVTLDLRPVGHDGSPTFVVDASGLRECLEVIVEALPDPSTNFAKLVQDFDGRLHAVEQLIKQQKTTTDSLRLNVNMLDSQVSENATHQIPKSKEDKELEAAVLKIQANFRGKRSRGIVKEKRKTMALQQQQEMKKFQQIVEIVQNEIEAKLLDIDVMELEKHVRESAKAIESLQKTRSTQQSEWTNLRGQLKVMHDDCEKYGRLLGNVNVLAMETKVSNLIKLQEADDLAQANDVKRLRELEERAEEVDKQLLDLRRQAANDHAAFTEKFADHAARLDKQWAEQVKIARSHEPRIDALAGSLDALSIQVKTMSDSFDSTALKMQALAEQVEVQLKKAEHHRATLEGCFAEFRDRMAKEVNEAREVSVALWEKMEIMSQTKADRSEMQAANEKIEWLIENHKRIELLEKFMQGAFARMDERFEAVFSVLERQTQETGKAVLLGTKPLRKCLSCQPLHDSFDMEDSDDRARNRFVTKVSKAIQRNDYISRRMASP